MYHYLRIIPKILFFFSGQVLRPAVEAGDGFLRSLRLHFIFEAEPFRVRLLPFAVHEAEMAMGVALLCMHEKTK